jgi:hypothetical protein
MYKHIFNYNIVSHDTVSVLFWSYLNKYLSLDVSILSVTYFAEHAC